MKPIKIIKVSGGYHVFVHDVPLVKDDKGVSFDRQKAGLPISGLKSGYRPPAETNPMLIKKANDASSLAHQIGRYVLGMGDFVFAYTELVGVEGSHEAWWNRANH